MYINTCKNEDAVVYASTSCLRGNHNMKSGKMENKGERREETKKLQIFRLQTIGVGTITN